MRTYLIAAIDFNLNALNIQSKTVTFFYPVTPILSPTASIFRNSVACGRNFFLLFGVYLAARHRDAE